MKPATVIKRLYWYAFTGDLVLIYPLYVVLFSDSGIGPASISLLLISWSVTSIIAEVPSGALADKYPRKYLLIASSLMSAIAFTVWLASPTLAGFAIGFMIWGIGGALDSGTYDALVYDELKVAKQEKKYVQVIGRAESIALVAVLVATVLAGAVIEFGFTFVLVLSVVSQLVTALIAASLPRVDPQKSTGEKKYFEVLRSGIREAVSIPTVAKLLLMTGFAGAIFGVVEEYIPLYFESDGTSLNLIPLSVAAASLTAAAASFVAHRFEKLSTAKLIAMLGISGLLLALSGSATGVVAVVMIAGYSYVITAIAVIYDGKLQHEIKGGERATITSVAAFLGELMAIAMFLAFGWIAETQGVFEAFQWFGLAVIITATMLSLARLKRASA